MEVQFYRNPNPRVGLAKVFLSEWWPVMEFPGVANKAEVDERLRLTAFRKRTCWHRTSWGYWAELRRR